MQNVITSKFHHTKMVYIAKGENKKLRTLIQNTPKAKRADEKTALS